MPATDEECAQLRVEEWQVLASIYPDSTAVCSGPETTSHQPSTIRIEVPVETELFNVQIVNDFRQPGSSNLDAPLQLALANFPPLMITLVLPSNYPLECSPTLVDIHAMHSWLSQDSISKLRNLLLQRWREDLETMSGCLWRTCEWIRTGDFLADIGLSLEQHLLSLRHPVPTLLAGHMEAYNKSVLDDRFAHTTFDCQICLTEVKGSHCLRLNCGHIFCRPCLYDFWSLCIMEGDVDRVMCADERCVKNKRLITEDEVRRVVSEEQTTRWKTIVRKRALESDPTLVYCPVAACQSPCPGGQRNNDLDSVDDVMMRRQYISLRSCDSCGFSFCILCKRAWHSISPCSSAITSQFLEQYMTYDDGHPEKLALERRFGKSQLARLVAKLREEEENERWLKNSTTPCPVCSTSVEKSTGCNHMTCSRCSCHFCYLCGLKLPPDNPYDHFSQNGPCKGQLFLMADWDPNAGELQAMQDNW